MKEKTLEQKDLEEKTENKQERPLWVEVISESTNIDELVFGRCPRPW